MAVTAVDIVQQWERGEATVTLEFVENARALEAEVVRLRKQIDDERFRMAMQLEHVQDGLEKLQAELTEALRCL